MFSSSSVQLEVANIDISPVQFFFSVFTYNPDWWTSRANIPHPQSYFLEEGASPTTVARVKAARKAAKVSKEDAVAH